MKPTDELREQVQEARAKLEKSLGAVNNQIAPQQLLERSVTTLKSEFPSLAKGAADFVKDNPLAVGVTLGGLAWLALGGGPSSDDLKRHGGLVSSGENRYPGDNAFNVYANDKYAGDYTPHYLAGHEDESLGDKAAELAGNVRDEVSEKARQVGEKLNEAGTKLNIAGGGVLDRGGDLAHQFADRAGPVANTAAQEMRQRPLAIAGVALLAGVAVGLALPNSRAERKLMGEKAQAARENAAVRARHALHEAEMRAKTAADDIAVTLKSAVGGEPTTGDAQKSKVEAAEPALKSGAVVNNELAAKSGEKKA